MAENNYVKFSPEKTGKTLATIKNVKKSINGINDEIEAIIKSVSINWQSDASKTICSNMKNSLNAFQSYVDTLTEISNYLQTTINEWYKAK